MRNSWVTKYLRQDLTARITFTLVARMSLGPLHSVAHTMCLTFSTYLPAVRDIELFEDAAEIILYRVSTEPEFFGDLTIRQAGGDQAGDLFFRFRQKRGLA